MRNRRSVFQGPVCLAVIASSLIVAGAWFSNARADEDEGERGLRGAVDPTIAVALREISTARIRANVGKLAAFGTRSTLAAQDDAAVSSGRGIGAAREWLKSEFQRYSDACGGCLQVKVDSFVQAAGPRIPVPTTITNIYAVLPGTDPQAAQRIVLVNGHYDSRNTDVLDGVGDAPGANDDATGTAVSLESARVLSKMRFPATIIFLTVAGEEQGLLGSAHFARMARQQGWNIEAMLNNDIVGGNRDPRQQPGVVRVFSEGVPLTVNGQQLGLMQFLGGENDSSSRGLARYVVETARAYSLGVKAEPIHRLDRFNRSSDHISFNQQGYAAVRFTEFREDFNRQHQNVRVENNTQFGDLLQFVDFDYVTRVARVNAATLATLASAPPPPQNAVLVTARLENVSTLHWDPSPGATSYEIVWRNSSSPEWEHVQEVRDGTTATLDIAKDNVIFAVRALDERRHRSLATVPVTGN